MIPPRYKDADYEIVPNQIKEKLREMRKTGSGRGLYIHGSVGSGKTYIAYAINKKWNHLNPMARATFWNTTELIGAIKDDFDREPAAKLRPEADIIAAKSLLVLDDIGSEKITEFVLETFYRIINHRYQYKLPTIFTSNLPISELAERIGDRTTSRIVEMCDIIELIGEDKRMENPVKITIDLNKHD